MACIVEHARGQLHIRFRKRIRRGGSREIGDRIIRRVQPIGGRILQPRHDTIAAVGQLAGLCPDRSEVVRGVELLYRRPLRLAVEIALRFGAEHVAQPVGNRLIRRRDIAGRLDGLGGWSRCRSDAGRVTLRRFWFAGIGLGGVGCGSGGLRCIRRWRIRLSALDFGGLGHRNGGDFAGLAAVVSGVAFSVTFGASAADDDASSLKSPGPGGGTLAGSGRGTAASIASSAASVARSIVLRQCRGRRHREESSRDRHQDAVISSTVLPTVTHYHTPWVSCPGAEQL